MGDAWKDFLWEMEGVVSMGGLVATIIYIVAWYKPIGSVWPKQGREGAVAFLSVVPVFSLLAIIAFIVLWGHESVRRDLGYILLYSFCGILFTGIGVSMLTRVVDISPVADCLHRNNIAVVFPVSATVFSAALMYSAMNMGEGDGWWCVFMPYLLGSGVMIAIMNIGDYVTFGQVILDLRFCWPVLLLFSVALVVELACKPQPDGTYSILAPYGSLHSRNAYILTFALAAGYLLLAFALIALFTPSYVWHLFGGGSAGLGYM
jgi:hypothetical protein